MFHINWIIIEKKNTFETIVDIFFKGKFTDSWNQVDCDIYAFFGLSSIHQI